MAYLSHLFSPIRVGSLSLANRIVLLPMALGYAEAGRPTLKLIRFLRERAVGGCGAICTPFSIFPVGDTFLGYMGLDASSDDYILPSAEVAGAMHACGVPVIGQLNTLTVWRKDDKSQLEVVGPSAFSARPRGHLPREMTVDEIGVYIRQHGLAARRLRQAGYDAVEVMGGVGNIISRFTSPVANQRKDEFGGNFENRMRLPLEIIREIQNQAGDDFTLLWRFSGHEFLEGGYDVSGAIAIGKALEKAGVKWLNIQVGWHDSPVPLITREVAQGSFAYISEAIKEAVSVPVVTSYRITDPVMANNILAEGKADLIGLARALISDAEWANKASNNRLGDINRCICCCRCVDQTVGAGNGLEICSVNARIGKDIETAVTAAPIKKKVTVVGAGPAGLEAARVCAERGHEVTLYDRAHIPGGMLNAAKLPPDKYEIGYLQEYLHNQARNLGVDIFLDHEVTAAALMDRSPDCAIIATGAVPAIPDIKGADKHHVLTAIDALCGTDMKWQRVVVIGGGFIGCELAFYINANGGAVTILDMLPKIGVDIGPSERFITVSRLKRLGIRCETGVTVTEITDSGVAFTGSGGQQYCPAEYVILATGMRSTGQLRKTILAKIKEIYYVGDCVEPRRIGEAVKEGYRAGISV